MSTRCSIGIWKNHQPIETIFCHWDGYPEWAGAILQDHYQNPDKVQSLIDHGDLSALGPEIGNYNTFGNRYNQNVCLFYARDRQEPGCEPVRYPNLHEWLTNADDSCAEYAYLFLPEKGLWIYHKMTWDESQWAFLEDCFHKTSGAG